MVEKIRPNKQELEKVKPNLKQDTKELKKELKKFKKVSTTPKGLEIAKSLVNRLTLIMKNHKNELDEKTTNNLNKSLSGLQFYINNIEKINKFKDKWNK